MFRNFIFTLLLVLFVGCDDVFVSLENDDYDEPNEPQYTFDINPRLPIDDNGYYHLTMDRNQWGTTHRISGNVYNEDKTPVELFWVQWESNLYWYLGDTLGYIISGHLNDSGIYVYSDTSYMIGFNGMEVPTSNSMSYSNSSGEVNNMIRPVQTMIGDTLRLTYHFYNGSDYIDIILD